MLLIALLWIKSWIGDVFLPNYVFTPKIHIALLSTNFLQIDWGNQKKSPSLVSLVSSEPKIGASRPKASCQVFPKPKPPQSLLLPTLIPSSKTIEADFFINRIWRSLQTLLNLNHPVEKRLKYVCLPVAVVKENQGKYEVWLNNYKVATLLDQITANSLQQRLTQLVRYPNLDPHQLRPALIDGTPVSNVG